MRVKDCTCENLYDYAKWMDQKSERLYQSIPLEKVVLEQRLERNWTLLIVLITISLTSKGRLHTSKRKTKNNKSKKKHEK